ncbi:MAG TPA: type VI secretion system contractile sheath large subunit, partial [Blastocatellia bacterium]|nr:type VI secretion system contractile sheath large subunit [Blastocatellia bacterium]
MTRKQPTKSVETVVTQEAQGDDLLSKILTEGRLGRDELQVERARDMIGQFVQDVMEGQLVMGRDMEASIVTRIAEIDRLLTAQLNEIMHAEEFQKLEGSWRGLHHLVFESETSTMLKIK